ncbi:MAG: hypothetical protein ACKPJJ_00195 [Planctomycetaceae bacterium]
MIKIPALLLPLLLLTTAGCRYDGSFMQMDSNAPFPFFGLQLSVDSGSRPTAPRQQHREQSIPLSLTARNSLTATQGRAHAQTRSHELKLVRLPRH